VVEDGDAVGEGVGFLEVLGGEEDGHPVGDEVADDLPHGAAAAGVEPGGGLVEEDHPWCADQSHGQVEAAPHSPGVGRQRPLRGVGQVEPLQQLAHPPPAVLAAQVAQVGHQLQVLPAGEQVVHCGELASHPDHGAHPVRVGGDVVAVDLQLPGVHREQGGQRPHQRGLA